MQATKSKAKAIAIALFLMLTIASLITFLPTASATEYYYNTHVYVGATPSSVGVNQEVLLIMWTDNIPPDIGEIEAAAGERAGWDNIGIDVTDPEGNTETFTIEHSDPVGGGWILYTPDQVGTYTVQAWFPETWKNHTTLDRQYHYNAAVSYEVTFTVEEEPIQPWLESPLPTRTWTRPINTASRDWYVLGGNWLGAAAQSIAPGCSLYGTALGFAPNDPYAYGPGPESAHILWTKPYYAGGIMDERFGITGYETAHYQGINLGNPIIIQGKLIVVNRNTAHTTSGWWVIDLYTGETLSFENDTTIPAFGQIYNYESPNQHGGFPYVWRTSGVTLPEGDITESRKQTWEMLDGFTFQSITKIANVTSGGTAVYGKDGSILRYNLVNYGTTANPNYYLQVWNSSAIPSMLGDIVGTSAWQWRPAGGAFGAGVPLGYYVHDGNTGFSLNVSIPSVLGPRNSVYNQTGRIYSVREDEYVIVGTSGRNDERGIAPGWMMALSLEYGEEGRKLWDTTFTPPAGSRAGNETVSLSLVDPEDGVILFEDRDRLLRWGYSLETGQLLWEGEPEVQCNYYGMTECVYEGKLLSYGYGGQLRAYNITTGEILWAYNATTVGFEIGYGGNYPIGICCIADGKLYTVSSEHSPTQPLWRGPNLRCINATNGEEIWKILFWGARMSPTEPNVYMADGIVVGLNYFDMELYAFGKGPSATTVSAPQLVPTVGSSVVITGTVTDQTATGRRNTNDISEFSLKGTPAISDEDMSAWMEYLFMQQVYPADAKGVEVVLETLDPNGNFYEIGRTTSDINGNYGVTWEPPVPGEYQIIATFAGSASYGPSHATTYMSVAEAPEPTPAPTPTPAPMTDTYVLGIGAGAIIAIIAVGLILILMMRKR